MYSATLPSFAEEVEEDDEKELPDLLHEAFPDLEENDKGNDNEKEVSN